MLDNLVLFAQEDVAKPVQEPMSLFGNLMLMLVIMAAFFFIVILPQQRKKKRDEDELMSSLKKNDEVITTAGIIGIVAHIKESGDEVTLKIDDNARMRVLRSAIVRIVKKDAAPAPVPTPPASDTNIKQA
ncbi:MAG: preprotein translocase subunit YajC [Gemmataceae bacterium]|nr:preprotein translocase subunit YajC [Gemmataceae bacterium]